MARPDESVIPLFPLPNVVLFPGMPLPLHIFEPRYREMVRDTLERPAEERFIGMVLLRGEWRKEYHANPEIFLVGCSGRLVNAEPLEDGRYNILLHGEREFEVQDQSFEHSYRQGRVRWRAGGGKVLAGGMRDVLEDRLRRLLADDPSGPATKLLGDASVNDQTFVNFFCYALDLSAIEKQSLLETVSLSERADRMCDVLDFALSGGMTRADGDDFRVH